ncbi:hypothetical protein K469DRAFT_810951 [Zopfia rhizophila CBS 207.26]|uniref:Uncharacterized protein n=1 Tax=Zopfia rhizophila CBS 207.26 TaxID=1314779 RepID=A0A6A6EGG6_9PEZI|nr:hypothetical protein K469DRAFT_810951 [Zopfia rhizophila CBS 207.26]
MSPINLGICPFQLGFFTDYFGYPYSATKYLKPIQMYVNFRNCRTITVGYGNFPLSLTTVDGIAVVVTEAIENQRRWPVIGGIRVTQITMAGLIELGVRLRSPYHVERMSTENLKAGKLKSS